MIQRIEARLKAAEKAAHTLRLNEQAAQITDLVNQVRPAVLKELPELSSQSAPVRELAEKTLRAFMAMLAAREGIVNDDYIEFESGNNNALPILLGHKDELMKNFDGIRVFVRA